MFNVMKLGINTVLFKAFDVKTALKAIKLAGYDGAELSAIQGMCEHLVLDAWETQVPLVKAAAKEAGVELLSMEVASLDEDRLEKAFKAAQYLGIPVVNVGPGPNPGTPANQACGRGEINLYGYFKALVDAGYEGPVCLEVIGPEQTMQQAQAIASESYGYMNAILKLLNAR